MTKTRGALTFVFDDGYKKVYQNVLPRLQEYNFPGVFAIPLKNDSLLQTTNRHITPLSSWQDLKNSGHEIAAHSITHSDLTSLADDQLERELREPAETLNSKTLIYPGGAYNEKVIDKAKQYYHVARTVKKGFEKLPPSNPMELKTYNFTKENFSVVKANLLATIAVITNSWLIETYHMVDNDEKDLLHTVRTDDFAAHLKFISKLPIHVGTINEIINRYGRK